MKKLFKDILTALNAWHLKHHKCERWQVNYSQTWHESNGVRVWRGSEVRCTVCGKIEPGYMPEKRYYKEDY